MADRIIDALYSHSIFKNSSNQIFPYSPPLPFLARWPRQTHPFSSKIHPPAPTLSVFYWQALRGIP